MNNTVHYTVTFFSVFVVIIVVTFVSSCHTANRSQGKKSAGNNQLDSVILDKYGNLYAVRRFPDNNLWMVANLKLTTEGSYYYNDSAKYDKQFGRLYTWTAAQIGCASLGEGWRLPTKDDWYKLAENYGAVGREETNIEKRAYPPLLSGGNSQFNAVLGGGRNPDGSYARMDAHGFYWTISQHDSANAWYANFAKGSQALFIQAEGEKVRAFSVRCVKSAQGLNK